MASVFIWVLDGLAKTRLDVKNDKLFALNFDSVEEALKAGIEATLYGLLPHMDLITEMVKGGKFKLMEATVPHDILYNQDRTEVFFNVNFVHQREVGELTYLSHHVSKDETAALLTLRYRDLDCVSGSDGAEITLLGAADWSETSGYGWEWSYRELRLPDHPASQFGVDFSGYRKWTKILISRLPGHTDKPCSDPDRYEIFDTRYLADSMTALREAPVTDTLPGVKELQRYFKKLVRPGEEFWIVRDEYRYIVIGVRKQGVSE